jgi:hypothetical protein
VEEERIKSAFEIAMERISDLPELTPEEIAAQNEKKYRPIGKAIANKYVNGLITEGELPAELEKYQQAEGLIVRRGLITALCRTLKLQTDSEHVSRTIAGLVRLNPGKESEIASAAAKFQELARQFEKSKQERLENFEASFLHPFGISGTAVRVNPEENQYCKKVWKRLLEEYEPKLEHLRTELLKINDVLPSPRK